MSTENDATTNTDSITSFPFVVVEGVFNFRELGQYPVASTDLIVKPSFLYRSGDVSNITGRGKEQFCALGIKKVFDFRSAAEIARFNTPSPTIPGVEIISVPTAQEESFDPHNIAKLLQGLQVDEDKAFRGLYTNFLLEGAPAFGVVLKHVRDHPDEPCLVHCTVGKDRTGVFAAIWLMLIGVDDEHIIKDYALTTIGILPLLPILEAQFQRIEVFRENPVGAQRLGSSKPEYIKELLQVIRERFGGVEGYLVAHAGLTNEDIATIQQNYRVSVTSTIAVEA